ncbi:MAB_1171c family putative transporter [Streptomyces sp. NPDC000880]
MGPSGINIAFAIPALVLTIAFFIKLPSIIRFWSDPLLKAVGGLLVLACAVFLFAAPPTIAKVNDLTGVVNFSAPWVYTLLTAFCAACLVLIITWRGGPPAKIRRSVWWVVTTYTTVIIALWVLFALADVSVERVRDIDTYYANTLYMRELIVLYLVAHMVACVITSLLIWNWERRVEGWLRSGLVFLGIGYVLNLGYDSVKFGAIIARWNDTNMDWLSTHVAPPVACVSALLIAVGFILPHAGPRLRERWATRTSYRRLAALNQTLRPVIPPTAVVQLRMFSSKELHLMHRQTFIRDALLQLAPFVDEELRQRAETEALRTGASADDAQGLAAAVALLAAIDAKRSTPDDDTTPRASTPLNDTMRNIEAISCALSKPATVDVVRQRAAAMQESQRP